MSVKGVGQNFPVQDVDSQPDSVAVDNSAETQEITGEDVTARADEQAFTATIKKESLNRILNRVFAEINTEKAGVKSDQ